MENNNVYNRVFFWMFIGLMITFLTGFYVSTNINMLYNIFSTGLYYILAIIEIVLVIILSARLKSMKDSTAKIMFCLYSFVSGLTFSSIFAVYQMSSIMNVFGVTGVLFFVFSLFGKSTKIDLSKFGTILMMMLLGIVVISIINIFLGNSMIELMLSIVSIIVFLGITAYDMQKIKLYMNIYTEEKASIYGALQLYLDFINIFIDLLRLFGRNRD